MADIRDEHGRPIQLTDELGNPVQLTDEHGVPIHLRGVATTGAHGGRTTFGSELHNKMTHDDVTMGSETHGKGVATTDTHGGRTTIGPELRNKMTHDDVTMGSKTHGGTHFAPTPVDYAKRGGEAIASAGAATMGVAAGVGKAATGAVTGGGAPVSHTQAHGAGDTKKQMERSTSSSSSSSEDDGQGGRRKKKGLKEKIKEKLPGQHGDKAAHSTDTRATSTTTGLAATATAGEQHHHKKGLMEKIKDKLPGHH